MNTSPFVSIIVAIYNAEKYLNRCVDSLVYQTLKDIEILLINDGSTDNSGAICDEYAAKDSRIKVFHRTNHGVAATRQFGLEHCTGEYVIHCDSDDWVDLDMYEKMYNVAKQEQADMVICDYVEEYSTNSKNIPQKPTTLQPIQVLLDMFNFIHASCWNKLIKTDNCRKYQINFIEGVNYEEDKLFNIRILQCPISVAYCPNTYYHYDFLSNDNSYTRSLNATMVYQRVKSMQLIRSYLQLPSIDSLLLSGEINTAVLALKTNAYKPQEYYDTFACLTNAPILKATRFALHLRLIVWISIHLNYRIAYLLMQFKLYIRHHAKKIKDPTGELIQC